MPKYQIFIERDGAIYAGLLWDIQTGHTLVVWRRKTAGDIMTACAKSLNDPDFVKDCDLDPAAVAELLGGHTVKPTGTGNDETGTPSPAGSPPPRYCQSRSCRNILGTDRVVVISGHAVCDECAEKMFTAIVSDRTAKVKVVPPAPTTGYALGEAEEAQRRHEALKHLVCQMILLRNYQDPYPEAGDLLCQALQLLGQDELVKEYRRACNR